MAYVRVPEGEDVNNAAELTGLLQAVQDEASPGGALHIFTDSLVTSLRQMRRWIFGPLGEVGPYTTTLLSFVMVQALRRGACRVGVHKQRVHVESTTRLSQRTTICAIFE
eukprot:55249-Prorocentrum_minimum.AAC.1